MATQGEIDALFRNVTENSENIKKMSIDDLYDMYNNTNRLLELMYRGYPPSHIPSHITDPRAIGIYRYRLQKEIEAILEKVREEIERREKIKEEPETKPKSIGGRKSNKRKYNRRRRTNKHRRCSNKRKY